MKKLVNRYVNAFKAIPYSNGTFKHRATSNTCFKKLIHTKYRFFQYKTRYRKIAGKFFSES